MEDNSPLQYLNIDVSQYLYETYYPTIVAKENKKIVNHQLVTSIENYLSTYKLDNIYEYETTLCIRGCLYRKITYLQFITENRLKYRGFSKKVSRARANQIKNEAMHLKKIKTIFL